VLICYIYKCISAAEHYDNDFKVCLLLESLCYSLYTVMESTDGPLDGMKAELERTIRYA